MPDALRVMPLVGPLVRRGVGTWIVVRAAFAALSLAPPGLMPSPVGVIGLCAVLALINVRRAREAAFWDNLAVSSTQLALSAGLVATMCEAALAVVGVALPWMPLPAQ